MCYDETMRQRHLHRGHAVGGTMNAAQFVEALREHLRVEDRQIHIRVDTSWGPGKEESVYIDFVNLPQGTGGAGGGAEAQNNRSQFFVRGFGPAGAPPPSGKVKAENVTSHLYRGELSRENRVQMRAKSGAPAMVAKYVADFLNRVVADVPPRFTHTGQYPRLGV